MTTKSAGVIVKVQLSLASSEPERSILVYDEGREIFHVFRESEAMDVAAILDEKPLKRAYFRAHLDENQKLVLDEETQEQDW